MDYSVLISVMILLSCFVLIANRKVKSYVRTFRFQSILIAIAAGIMGYQNLKNQQGVDILVICAIIVALKVIYIPKLLLRTFKNVKREIDKDYFLNVPYLEFISLLIVLFVFYIISSADFTNNLQLKTLMVNAISVILIGLLFMISRKKAIGQIVGFLVIENGLFITAMFSTHGMPIIIDVGIFIDLITAVFIMGMMVFMIDTEFESIDINKLKNLRG